MGYGFALTASAFYGGSTVIAKTALEQSDISAIVFTAFSLLFGAAIVYLIFHRSIDFTVAAPKRHFGFMMAAGVSSATAVTLLIFAVSRAPVSVVTPIMSLNPLFTLVLAHLFLRRLELVTPRVLLGTTFAVVGVVLVILGGSQL